MKCKVKGYYSLEDSLYRNELQRCVSLILTVSASIILYSRWKYFSKIIKIILKYVKLILPYGEKLINSLATSR